MTMKTSSMVLMTIWSGWIIIIIIVIIFLSCLIHIAAWNDLSFVYIIGAKYISFVRQFIGMMITEHFLLITQILMIITQMLMLITKSKPYWWSSGPPEPEWYIGDSNQWKARRIFSNIDDHHQMMIIIGIFMIKCSRI